ncbi:MAG: hypothetical protein MIO90_01285 [Methanomassiliicoccales archaeon]|nr:hypothetical protein [Methanomassiliicoccales archaeon]
MGVIEELMDFLNQVQGDPFAYSVIFLFYVVAATIILPIPVELMLFLSPATPFIVKAVLLGIGKAVGSMLVFYIGVNVEGLIIKLSEKWKFFRVVVSACRWFTNKLGYLGLYLIMSVPLMVDTVPVYLFSIFREDGMKKDIRIFALVNLAAGITRAAIVYMFFELLGIKIF